MDIGNRIRSRRKELGLTLKDVAKALGVSESLVSRYESSEVKHMGIDKLPPLAKILETTPAELMGWTKQNEQYKNQVRILSSVYNYYPVGISAGMLEEVETVHSSDELQITIPNVLVGKYAGNKNLCFMRVNGESMNRVIDNHSTIAVLTNISLDAIKNGDIVVAANGHGEYTIKRFFNDPENERFILQPDSNDFSFLPLVFSYDESDDMKIFGKVVIYSVIL